MTLAADLLEQAWHLAKRERRRPRQASLRRAVSAAYYSVFHLVTADGAARVAQVKRFRPFVARAFDHKALLEAARAVGHIDAGRTRRQRNPHWLDGHFTNPLDGDLVSFCETLSDLQGSRHEADYDTARSFVRSDVTSLLQQAEQAHAAWARVSGHDDTLVFVLVALKLLKDR